MKVVHKVSEPNSFRFTAHIAVTACSLCLLVVSDSAHAQLQKRINDADDINLESPEEATSLNLPAWERQFFAALQSIDDAIKNLEDANEEIENTANPLLKKDLLESARQRYSAAIQGKKLIVHFKLSDITPGKTFSRYKQAFELTLSEPTFPSHEYKARVTVVISPTHARRLTLGSIVRVEGQLSEADRDSFERIYFARKRGIAPLPGDQQYRGLSNRAAYPFTYYVDNTRVLTGKLLEEYKAFLPRYQARIAEYSPYSQ
tara:strand:+ start:5812 stop:6591 length:780 start_codon:yes stop_codon:yes gene_type:complete